MFSEMCCIFVCDFGLGVEREINTLQLEVHQGSTTSFVLAFLFSFRVYNEGSVASCAGKEARD